MADNYKQLSLVRESTYGKISKEDIPMFVREKFEDKMYKFTLFFVNIVFVLIVIFYFSYNSEYNRTQSLLIDDDSIYNLDHHFSNTLSDVLNENKIPTTVSCNEIIITNYYNDIPLKLMHIIDYNSKGYSFQNFYHENVGNGSQYRLILPRIIDAKKIFIKFHIHEAFDDSERARLIKEVNNINVKLKYDGRTVYEKNERTLTREWNKIELYDIIYKDPKNYQVERLAYDIGNSSEPLKTAQNEAQLKVKLDYSSLEEDTYILPTD